MLLAHVSLVVIGGHFASNLSLGQSGGACSLAFVGCGGPTVVLGLILAVVVLAVR